MKSHFLFCAKSVFCKSLVVLSVLLFSQAGHAQKVTPVVLAGIGLSDWTLTNGSTVKTGMLPSLDLGLMLDYNINNSLMIESGLQFSEVGARVKLYESDSPKYSLGYINIPAFGKIRLPNGISIYAGPKAGFLISAKEKYSEGTKSDVKAAFKNADFSLAGGINYKLPVGVEVGIHFNYGILNIYKNGSTHVRNYGFGVMAAYSITMPKA